MTRVANLASSAHLTTLLARTQSKVAELNIQLASEKVAQSYSDLPQDARTLLSLENTRTLTARFKHANELMQVRLDAVDVSLSSVDRTVRSFRSVLLDAGGGAPLTQQQVAELQTAAFRGLQEMQSALNAKVDGRSLFAGGRITTTPVDLGLTTLEGFQARYDGRKTLYATGRDDHLIGFSLDPGGSWLTIETDPAAPTRIRVPPAQGPEVANIPPGTLLTISATPGHTFDGVFTVGAIGADGLGPYIEVVEERLFDGAALGATVTLADGTRLNAADLGGLTFDGAADTITASTPGVFAGLAVGTIIRVGSAGSNDGVFEVQTAGPDTIQIVSRRLSDSGGAIAASLAAASYYRGDDMTHAHRTDDQRAITFDLTAIDPAFEKAIRAMGMIAQGAFGTTGGLEHHRERIGQALQLLNDALGPTDPRDLATRGERPGNLADAQRKLGFDRVILEEAVTRQRDLLAHYDMKIAGIENINTFEVVTRLLDESRALEASYQALARIRSLSLSQFLR